MTSKSSSKDPVGVLGAGSFGTVIANMLAEKTDVILYARTPERAKNINDKRESSGQPLHERITVTNDLELVAKSCNVIFPVVPSANLRELIRRMSPYLRPYHILIHGTKGFDVSLPDNKQLSANRPLSRDYVKTMSEVIMEESSVVRVGCLAGPNLAGEMAARQPAASVVASHFDEVINAGQQLLKNERFLIYGNSDLIGVELCGVLKNIIAIGAGVIHGLGLGENAKALLISRGMVEMIYIGQALGGNTKAFIGLAGVGDLIATCSSQHSRNFTVGTRLARGEKIKDIIESMEETAEGVRTIEIVKSLSEFYKVRCPITEALHNIINEEMTVGDATTYLMKFPFRAEIDFL
ncbi:NAD(P)H-dependent glycerol-3-phosphate dehydrogenase [uncultured Imperialibacter sp.]|uniref:NAD(P)H-dependent glycerol-3-phosphate dehydrogenase n=1 Tax=uncultured Imperialibacter sp. TaxID=1672639 RepID=UPI0030D951F1|tara:strand:+ start:42597 stop:43652 length:1056 start_codon:yes stop_codon:yes gene_type:complete